MFSTSTSTFTSTSIYVIEVSNLNSSVSDQMINDLFFRAMYIQRESVERAFVCYKCASLAERIVKMYNNYQIETTDVFLVVKIAPMFLQRRFNELIRSYPLQAVSQKSVYIKAMASCKLPVLVWSKIFPTAFDIYRTNDHCIVYVHFKDVATADQAVQSVHHKLFHLPLKERVAVFFACVYTNKHEMDSNNTHSEEVKNVIRTSEQLCHSIVNWLYV